MKFKKFLTFKSLTLFIILVILLFGALFLTDLMPPLNKQNSSVSTNPTSGLADNANKEAQKKETVAVNNPNAASDKTPQNSTDSKTTAKSSAVLGCKKQEIPYKVVYTKVLWLSEGETKVANQGRQGYMEICSSSIKDSQPKKVTVPAIDEQIFVGAKTRSVMTKITDETQKILDSLY